MLVTNGEGAGPFAVDTPPNGDGAGVAADTPPNGEGAGAPLDVDAPPNGLAVVFCPKGDAVANELAFEPPKGELIEAVEVTPCGFSKGELLVAAAPAPADDDEKVMDLLENGDDPEEPCPTSEVEETGVFSSGLGTLYLAASFLNMSTSRPLYF